MGFFENGIRLQFEATTISQANKRFWYGCNEMCIPRGINIRCKDCKIRVANEIVIADFEGKHTREVEALRRYRRGAHA